MKGRYETNSSIRSTAFAQSNRSNIYAISIAMPLVFNDPATFVSFSAIPASIRSQSSRGIERKARVIPAD